MRNGICPACSRAMTALYESEITAEELASQPWTREELIEEFQEDAQDAYAAKEEELGPELMREVERFLMLQIVDSRWREHLDVMEYLREGIHLRAMAQKDPLSEYRSEGHAMFTELSATIREEVLRHLFHVQIDPAEQPTLEPARSSRRRREREPHLRARVGLRLGCDPRGGRCGRDGGRRRDGAGPGPARAARRHRVGHGRPQRPVPLRLRQEVQEVPRRLNRRAAR